MGRHVASALVVGLAILLTPAMSEAHSGSCSRIQVETRDRGVMVGSYVVKDPDYVAKRHAENDQNGEDGTWTVSAGELGQVGYTVTYSCLS
jgi:hypothetical protein